MDGHDLKHCGAKTKPGTPCKRSAGWGTSHLGVGRCRRHGGNSPRAEVAGVVELARRDAHAHGMAEGVPIDPHDAILKCIKIAHAEVIYATERVAELDPEELIGPTVTTRPLKQEKGAESPSRRVEEHGPPAVHIWLKVRHDAMIQLVTFSKVAIAAGIAERQIAVAEGQAQLIADFARSLMQDLGVDPASEQARGLMRKHLTLMAGGRAA